MVYSKGALYQRGVLPLAAGTFFVRSPSGMYPSSPSSSSSSSEDSSSELSELSSSPASASAAAREPCLAAAGHQRDACTELWGWSR